MRIHRLFLESFASYEKQELNFDELGSLINVYGPTGAGKTTLLVDAMTFCLFGRAYGEKEASSSKLVIRPPLKRAKAELEFSVENKRYKVVREVFLDSPSKVFLLEFSNNSWIKKAEGAKEVDKILSKLIGFDYDIFLKSIVVRQGEVSEILEASPSERRHTFLKMLNIDFSEHLEIAKKKRDELKNRLSLLLAEEKRLKDEISEEDKHKINKKQVEEQLKTLTKLLITKEEELKKIESEFENLRNELARISNILQEALKKKEKLNNLKIKKNEIISRIENLKNELNKKYEFNSKFDKIKKEIEELEKNLNYIQEYNLLKKQLENNIEEKKRVSLEIEEINEKERKIKEIERLKEYFNSIKNELDKLNGDLIQNMQEKSAKEQLLIQTKKIKDALELAGPEAKCPVCGSLLGEERLGILYSHYDEEMNKLESEIALLSSKISELEKIKNEKERRKEELQKEIALEDEFKKEILKKNELQNKLDSLNESINRIEKRIAEISAKIEISEVSIIEVSKKKLLKEYEEVSKKLGYLDKIPDEIKEMEKQLSEIESEIKELEDSLSKVPSDEEYLNLQRKFNEIGNKKKILREAMDELIAEKGRLEQRIKELELKIEDLMKKKEELNKIEKELVFLKESKEIYDLLCEDVFNEKGFPLYFLDSYLQDLNYILNEEFLSGIMKTKRVEIKRISDRIEIEVYDGIYKRDLSTYSGGEKTAIGFALRLAIAKTLALRRGIKPSFLIIDEGFGPLSLELRSSILESIIGLRKDYEKIFVISHLEDIQDNPVFDSVIKVFKDENGISHAVANIQDPSRSYK